VSVYRWARYLLTLGWIETRHAAVLAGYWLRPYDDLADARRWRWQRRHPCQHTDGLEAVMDRWESDR
jgi:hypothetical protein